jgi:thioesterase domain-containing protein
VAYEIAFNLIGEDEVVEFLGVIDSRERGGEPAMAEGHPGNAYNLNPLPVTLHLFAAGHNRSQLQLEWTAVAGPRLSIEAVAASDPANTQASFARCIVRAVRNVCHAGQKRSVTSNMEYQAALPIQTGSPGSVPVYCVPGAGANITSFMALAQALGLETAVTGLQPRGTDRGLVPHTSVTAAARFYVSEIMKIERRGAFRLLGHSFGGWVVFEMARLLIEAGRRVDSLVLIDTQPPSRDAQLRHLGRVDVLMKLIETMEQAIESSFCLTRNDLEKLSHEAQLSKVMDRMKSVGLLPAAARLDAMRSLVRVFSVNVNTVFAPSYRFPGEMLLVQAADPCSYGTPDPDDLDNDRAAESWAHYAQSLTRFEAPGNHMTMLKAPHVEALAGRIATFLNRIR